MIVRTALTFAFLCDFTAAAVRSGQAEVDWLLASSTYEPGKPVQTAVRMVMDPGWHTYWENPGEAGMEVSATWKLPDGWTTGGLEHPVPIRFEAGGLVGFGYKGSVLFPVKFTPPAGFTGVAKLRGELSWLACNDDQCLPGKAELEITLDPGAPAVTPEAKIIMEALAKVPQPAENSLRLKVSEKPHTLLLRLENDSGTPLNPGNYEIFPVTPLAVDPAASIRFTQTGSVWVAEVAKNEYLTQPLKNLSLVFAGKSGQAPIFVKWKTE
jgi:DsbC/DsbD-like thiol-disulfide interchange protein